MTDAMSARSESVYGVKRGEWTAELVREHLPAVLVAMSSADPEPRIGAVTGRRERFATVGPVQTAYRVHVAWSTIAHCINQGVPVDLS